MDDFKHRSLADLADCKHLHTQSTSRGAYTALSSLLHIWLPTLVH